MEIRVNWTAILDVGSAGGVYNAYSQWFNASAGGKSTGDVNVVPFNTWGKQEKSVRKKSKSSNWITVPLNTTDSTNINLAIKYYQRNANNSNMDTLSYNWSIPIPAY